MLKKYIIIFYSSILYRCMRQIQGTLSTPRLSTSSKKGIKPGRVQLDRNPFDRLLPFSPFPLGRAFREFSQWSENQPFLVYKPSRQVALVASCLQEYPEVTRLIIFMAGRFLTYKVGGAMPPALSIASPVKPTCPPNACPHSP